MPCEKARRPTTARARSQTPRPERPPRPRGPTLEERAIRFFAADGPLSARKPGYSPRPQQLGYARAAARAVEEAPTAQTKPPGPEAAPVAAHVPPPSLFFADCPTGTGKSLASLVPMALAGRGAVYSTATIALQSQLVNSELPLLARTLGTDARDAFSYAVLKGRGNYLCDNRLDALFRAPPPLSGPGGGPSPEELGNLASWRPATRTGEREDFPERPSLWPLINVDPHDCAPLTCRFRDACFYLSSAKKGRDARILVVNHALLAANAVSGGALFPMDDRVLIIDEAHRLPEALSSAYGVHLTLQKALHVARSARRDPARASRCAAALDWAAEDFFRELAGLAPGALEDDGALPDPEALAGSLVALKNVLQGSPAGEGRAVAGMANGLLRDLRSFYKGRDTHARAVVPPEGDRPPELRSWLVDVGPAFAWDLLARSGPDDDAAEDGEREPVRGPVTVLCSATLATGSGQKRSFAHARRTLGVPLLLKTRPGTRYEEHCAEEAFDYKARALLYLERALPEPTRDNAEEYARACAARTAELLEASRGRALVLLSTARAVRIFREHLDVPYPARYGTDGAPTGPLVEWLKSTPNAVLVGTRSLWEGVDIAGPQVSLVVIDKIPFAAPNDPVNKALAERAGPDWFRLVSLPAAQVALRQGAGRLIRSASDRGVLALLDPRVSGRSWGQQIVSSLPPPPRQTPSTACAASSTADLLSLHRARTGPAGAFARRGFAVAWSAVKPRRGGGRAHTLERASPEGAQPFERDEDRPGARRPGRRAAGGNLCLPRLRRALRPGNRASDEGQPGRNPGGPGGQAARRASRIRRAKDRNRSPLDPGAGRRARPFRGGLTAERDDASQPPRLRTARGRPSGLPRRRRGARLRRAHPGVVRGRHHGGRRGNGRDRRGGDAPRGLPPRLGLPRLRGPPHRVPGTDERGRPRGEEGDRLRPGLREQGGRAGPLPALHRRGGGRDLRGGRRDTSGELRGPRGGGPLPQGRPRAHQQEILTKPPAGAARLRDAPPAPSS